MGVGVVVDDALEGTAVVENLSLDGFEGSNKVREVGCKVISVCQLCSGRL